MSTSSAKRITAAMLQGSSHLHLLLLSDGRPGHVNLSEGIAAAIARRRPVKTHRIEVRRGRWPGRVVAALVNANVAPHRILRIVYKLDADTLPHADLVVSAGAETLAANVAAARFKSIPNVFYGSLRQFRPADFTLVLSSYAGRTDAPNRVRVLKPSAIDPDTLVRPASRSNGGRGPAPAVAGLLIGGDSGEFVYAESDWRGLLDFLTAAHRAFGTRWLATNSRRTPPDIGDRLAALVRGGDPAFSTFIDVRSPGSGTLRQVFEQAEVVVCTDDSSTMVSEAISARLPVVGLSPLAHRFTAAEQNYRDFLAANGWYRSLPIAGLTPDGFAAVLGDITPIAYNPLDRLADVLDGRLPELFLRKKIGGKKVE
ncbi:MAG: ELM1/GtrOC1 family putative glycosyltransferase [Hyphomicrobiaceae bacterium]